MNTYTTTLKAIDKTTGELLTFEGQRIQAPTWDLAQEYCDTHFGYLTISGRLVAEINEDGNITDFNFNYN